MTTKNSSETQHTPIRTPVWQVNCRCRDCILDPYASHGIYLIGAYKIPSRLSLRGGRITEPGITWEIKNGCSQSRTVPLPEHLKAPEPRYWAI